MITLILSLLAAGAAGAMAPAPMPLANAQSITPASAVVAVPEHQNWTLRERETWLDDRLDKARSDGAVNHGEFDRVRDQLSAIHGAEEGMRDHDDGELTFKQTVILEDRLDAVAEKIHWLYEDNFQRPW